jgi:two-component system LytT family sensor kinase
MGRSKHTVRQLAIFGSISIGIGVLFLLILNPKALLNPMVWLRNGGYSLMLGSGLFLAGRFFTTIGNRYMSWLKKPFTSLLISFLSSLLYSSVVIFFTNWFWYIVMRGISWEEFWQWGTVIIVWEYVVFYAISLIMFAKAFFAEWKQSVLEKERLRNEALALQYETLSNQVNPHFLFNSLNVLLSLIDHDTEAAKKFTSQLAAFYRDLLSLKDKQTIPLSQELKLMGNYLDLLQIRFRQALKVTMTGTPNETDAIIPLTLQLLVENAMKHNIISDEQPLHLEIEQTGHYIIVRNTLQKKAFAAEPSRIGLKNLNERYLFLTGQSITITETTSTFEVRIPLIEYEL